MMPVFFFLAEWELFKGRLDWALESPGLSSSSAGLV